MALSIALAGCGGSQSGSTASPVPSAGPTVTPSASESALPTVSASALPTEAPTASAPPVASLYIRMWSVYGSIGPQNFFFSSTVISGGRLYYVPQRPLSDPRPLYVSPLSRTISPAGIATIVAEARHDGLLGATHDFSCPHSPDAGMKAGAGTPYLQIVIDGVAHNLSGGCNYQEPSQPAGTPAPGTYWAFEDFFAKLGNMEGWLGDELGSPSPWDPNSLMVFASLPDEAWWSPEVDQSDTVGWLAGKYADFGKLSDPGNSQERCGLLTGAALTRQLPSIKAAHEGTLFADSTNQKRVLAIHALMPNEPPASSCS